MAPAQNANYRFNDYVAKITSMKEILRAPDFRNIGSGEIGGKARGLSVFVDALQEEKERLAKEFGKEIFIAVPKATVIRTSVFEEFVGKNNLWSIVRQNLPNDEIDKAFLAGKFSSEAIEQFDKLL
ncbi:hypothetical protein FJZ26_05770, partial [Candidatus Parvarchaeota archaeon]|nr:hypothetical protein [Candidatus Parvarchaeota archaeon]